MCGLYAPVFWPGGVAGIASGKSEASRFFRQLGVPVIDADIIAHQVMQRCVPPPEHATPPSYFGVASLPSPWCSESFALLLHI